MFSFRSRGGVEDELDIIILSEITEFFTPGGRKSPAYFKTILDKARAVKEWDINKAARFLNEHSSDLQEDKLPLLLKIICSSLPTSDTHRLLRSIADDDPHLITGLIATRQPAGPDSDEENVISIFGDNEEAIPGLVQFLNEYRKNMSTDDFLTLAAMSTVEWFTDELEGNKLLTLFVTRLIADWSSDDIGVFLSNLAVDNDDIWESESADAFFKAISAQWDAEQKQGLLDTARGVWGWDTTRWDKLYIALHGKPFDRPPKKVAAAPAGAKGVHQIPGVGEIPTAGGAKKKKKKKKKKTGAETAGPTAQPSASASKPAAGHSSKPAARRGAAQPRAAPAAGRPAGDSDEFDEDDDDDVPDLDDLFGAAGVDPSDMEEMLQNPAMLAQMMQMMAGGNPFMGMGGFPGGMGGFGGDDDSDEDEAEAVPLRGGRGGGARSRPGGRGAARGARPRHRY